jgi:hypothetical protein
MGWLAWISRFMAWYARQVMPSTDNEVEVSLEPPVKPRETPQEPSNRAKLYQTALSCYGKDMAPQNDYVGCAEALSHIFLLAKVPNFKKVIFSTIELDLWLSTHLKEVPLTEALYGDILISVTGTGNGKSKGHVGILGKNHQHVMSNNSYTGLWDDHWTLPEWLAFYKDHADLRTKTYRYV